MNSVTQLRSRPDMLADNARQLYAYDPDGNQIETLFQDMQGGNWADLRKETFLCEREPR